VSRAISVKRWVGLTEKAAQLEEALNLRKKAHPGLCPRHVSRQLRPALAS